MVKDKLRIKHEVNKSNVTNSFREIWNEIDNRLILEKKKFGGRGGTAAPQVPPISAGLYNHKACIVFDYWPFSLEFWCVFSARYLNVHMPRKTFYLFRWAGPPRLRLYGIDHGMVKADRLTCRVGSAPYNQKSSCKWNLSFFRTGPLNGLSYLLGHPTHQPLIRRLFVISSQNISCELNSLRTISPRDMSFAAATLMPKRRFALKYWTGCKI